MHRPRSSVGTLLTPEAYLAFEEQSPVKHEYVAGEVFAMSGVTIRHNLITLNITRALHQAARRRGCRIFAADIKLHVADRVYYPDVMLTCGKAEPALIVEVTSPSTRATDRREKLEAYRRIPSLLTYLIADQRRRHVLAYTRQGTDQWLRQEFQGDDVIPIPSLDSTLSLGDLYEDVTLPPLAVGEEDEEDLIPQPHP